MKLLDKLKNALFEEEYVEVEEKPKKKEIKKEKRQKVIEKAVKESKIEEKPIAKKIVQQERKEPKEEIEVNEDEHLGEALAYQENLENEFKFPMVSDNEFTSDAYLKEEPIKKEKKPKKKIRDKNSLYQGKNNFDNKPYGLDELDLQTHEYGAYEKKEDRTYFKPSPIISPIYGILDKNYTKDDINTKREIRLTSGFSRENINVDDVRKKAFGTLNDDIEIDDNSISLYDDEIEDNNLLDLSSDNKTPEVNKVTMGDAEEYFEDLGLEYNVDYKDNSKEKANGRRVNKDYDDINDNNISSDIEEPVIKNEVKISDSNDLEDDNDNLFDLIDSMYDKE